MRNKSGTLGTALLLVLLNLGITSAVLAQRQYRDNDRTMRSLTQRIETRTDTFRRGLQNALDRSQLNGTAREDEINRIMSDFEVATDRLQSRFENRQSTAADVRIVLDNAARINRFVIDTRLGANVEQNWRLLQTDLDQLARAYYITDWQWTGGSGVGSNVSDPELRQLVRRVENRATRFSRNFRLELNRSTANSSERNEARRHLSEFETALARLRNRVNNRTATNADVQTVLDHAAYLNTFVTNNRLSARAESDWNLVRTDLGQLASAYNVAWNENPIPSGPIYDSRGELTGTYRLTSQTSDARVAAENATRNLPAAQRQRVYDSLLRRLDPPETIAIDRRGTNVTIASSRAAQINFVADGREHVETMPNGRTVRVRANLSGDQLTIERTGERAQDFTVTFASIDNGRRLVVTRRLYTDQLNQPVTVQSYYDRTSNVAQLDLYRGTDNANYPDTTATGDFIVSNGTQIVAVLNQDLSTETAREGDRVTLNVRSPEQFRGATIEGRVLAVDRSGRVSGRSELSLDFDTIRMADGRTYRFAGILETVRTPNNEVVRVDNEGAVRDSDQTNKTVTRTAIGTAVGAIIGAIAGGGKGAAIGAVIGAGAGAGSVYIQGREDLDLPPGTEVTIRATGPR